MSEGGGREGGKEIERDEKRKGGRERKREGAWEGGMERGREREGRPYKTDIEDGMKKCRE